MFKTNGDDVDHLGGCAKDEMWPVLGGLALGFLMMVPGSLILYGALTWLAFAESKTVAEVIFCIGIISAFSFGLGYMKYLVDVVAARRASECDRDCAAERAREE